MSIWYCACMDRVHLLGIPIDPVSMEQALERVLLMLSSDAEHHVMTPNAEMLVESSRNPAFCDVLRKGALNIPDGISLVWVARLTGQHLPERVAGVDFVQRICAVLTEKHSVFLLGGREGVGRGASEKLQQLNPHLCIAGIFEGTPDDADAAEMIQRINEAKPHILFVAYGAPRQDLWIEKHLALLPSVRVAMGVGGTFDFIAGVRQRAPQIFQSLGLEWLWRFILEPKRWRRMWRAVVVFPLLVLRYRQNGNE